MGHDTFMHHTDLHRECWDLLPWIANERATPQEMSRIDDHLRECNACREELDSQRKLRAAMRAEAPVVIAPQTSLQKLMQRIDGNDEDIREPVPAPTSVSPASRAPKRTARPPQWLAIAAGIQGIAIAVLVATLWLQSREQQLTEPRYETLTSTPVTTPGPVLRVVFADGIALSEANEILRTVDAQIVAGPTIAGVYTLALNTTDAPAKAAERIAARLRQDRRIAFAEVAMAQPRSP